MGSVAENLAGHLRGDDIRADLALIFDRDRQDVAVRQRNQTAR